MCKKILATLMLAVLMLSLAACGKDKSADNNATGSETQAAGEDVAISNYNADKKIDEAEFALDGTTLSFGTLSVQAMKDAGFVLTTDADWDESLAIRGYGQESFSFVKAGSEDDFEAALVTLVYSNPSENDATLGDTVLTSVLVELGDEATGKKFDDCTITCPWGVKTGMSLDELKDVFGEPIGEEEADKVSYTTYTWLIGENGKLSVDVGETVGAFNVTCELVG